uniref:Cyclin N-terminal domain-containing protein n=1 Tax=Macrostomum lignano TaxID=282301 RepID=A0A1I8F5H1_9PLAT
HGLGSANASTNLNVDVELLLAALVFGRKRRLTDAFAISACAISLKSTDAAWAGRSPPFRGGASSASVAELPRVFLPAPWHRQAPWGLLTANDQRQGSSLVRIPRPACACGHRIRALAMMEILSARYNEKCLLLAAAHACHRDRSTVLLGAAAWPRQMLGTFGLEDSAVSKEKSAKSKAGCDQSSRDRSVLLLKVADRSPRWLQTNSPGGVEGLPPTPQTTLTHAAEVGEEQAVSGSLCRRGAGDHKYEGRLARLWHPVWTFGKSSVDWPRWQPRPCSRSNSMDDERAPSGLRRGRTCVRALATPTMTTAALSNAAFSGLETPSMPDFYGLRRGGTSSVSIDLGAPMSGRRPQFDRPCDGPRAYCIYIRACPPKVGRPNELALRREPHRSPQEIMEEYHDNKPSGNPGQHRVVRDMLKARRPVADTGSCAIRCSVFVAVAQAGPYNSRR